MEMLARDYKFLLALENSNCVDYVTEKFFNVLANSVIPVVMGARKVDHFLCLCYACAKGRDRQRQKDRQKDRPTYAKADRQTN